MDRNIFYNIKQSCGVYEKLVKPSWSNVMQLKQKVDSSEGLGFLA